MKLNSWFRVFSDSAILDTSLKKQSLGWIEAHIIVIASCRQMVFHKAFDGLPTAADPKH